MERIPALDSLRAVAMVMVIGYHLDRSLMPAGYWGVMLFFVLSGYLITRLLIAEADESGRIDIWSFYSKRALRLFPALVVVCLFLFAIGIGWSQIGPALGHYSNYARIAGFDLGLLTHTWFLAVMAHFYLLWPLVIAAVPARYRLRALGVLALAAVAWRVIAIEVVSPGWVYNATDTNAAALLAGCYLGVARPRTWRFAGLALPALVVLMFIPFVGEEGAGFLWSDFLAIALSVVIVQYAVSGPRWLENGALLWLGEVSYGLYLWHYVLINLDIPLLVALPLSLVAAAASWYLIEKQALKWSERFAKRRREVESPSSELEADDLAATANRRR